MSKRLIYLVLFALLGAFVMFQSCSDTPVTTEETAIITDAGTGYTFTNTFCGEGKLQIKSPLGYNPQALGSQLILWGGVGNAVAGTEVGNVYFYPTSATTMNVKFEFNQGVMYPYIPTSIHLDVASSYAGLHKTKQGNPIPGQFDYKFEVPEGYTQPSYTFENIPIELDADGNVWVAAHAGGTYFGGIGGFNYYLPNNTVQLVVQGNPAPSSQAYWKFTINNAGFISTYDGGYGPGVYYGWCIDIDHTMGNQSYPAQLFSSYEALPSWLTGPGMLEYPENLDKVNYLINNFWTGKLVQPLSSCGVPYGTTLQALTYSDIQVAIWTLLENNTNYSGLQSWNQEKVNAILCDVNANGEGFAPGCNDKIVFIVVPNIGNTISVQLIIGQPIIGEVVVPCQDESMTCWGDGKYGAGFLGNNWGTYFKYRPVCPTP
jgi:hypothetical protein